MHDKKVCSRCVMDTSAPDIRFDDAGICNYCTDFIELLDRRRAAERDRRAELTSRVEAIRRAGRRRPYDCLVGVSGGLDSSFALKVAVELGLRPLAVHMDNGWNSELAVSNIERVVNGLGVELFTYVLDWEQFRDLQRSFIKAHVVDVEMLTDNAIQACMYRIAAQHGVKYILTGRNTASEGMRMPPGWNHFKADRRNIKAIHRRFGERRGLAGVPLFGLSTYIWAGVLRRIRRLHILEYVGYDREEAQAELSDRFGWRAYGTKHSESVFTRFYQGHILPEKFGIDKRRLHLSALVCSGQASRDEALAELRTAPYDSDEALRSDREFVLKKLGLSDQEFDAYLRADPVPHTDYPSAANFYRALRALAGKSPFARETSGLVAGAERRGPSLATNDHE